MVRLQSIKKRLTFIAVFMLALLVYLGIRNPEFNYYRLMTDNAIYKDNNGPKTILLGTIYHTKPGWNLGADTVNQSFFEENQCLYTNCLLTTNRTHLSSINFFDAIVFDSAKIFPNNTVPSTRSTKQLYVFAVNESPVYTIHAFKHEKKFYNLTMTYRIDSDILWSYGLIRDIKTKAVVAPSVRPHWKSPPDNFIPDEALNKKIEGRTKKAAWFVSHCGANSTRDNLAKGIQKKFHIDIYGLCGNLKCGQRPSTKCYKLLNKHYKFYLSFENSLCTDYVTEKLYNALQNDVIPVVYGGADYNRFAPPQSYINAEDFPTTSSLVEYLKYVDSNRTEYNKYFWWKKHYEVSYESPFCQLCTLLNTRSSNADAQFYKNIGNWWSAKQCRTPNMVFD